MKPSVATWLAAVMLAVGAFGLWQAWSVHSGDAAANHALTDATATAQVQESVSKALTAVLSYDAGDPQTTEQAAQMWLVGDAREEYETLYATLKEKAPKQQLRLSAQVQTVGVKMLTEKTGEALVFLDQSSQRVSDKEASVSAAQLAVTVLKRDGVWKISSLKPL